MAGVPAEDRLRRCQLPRQAAANPSSRVRDMRWAADRRTGCVPHMRQAVLLQSRASVARDGQRKHAGLLSQATYCATEEDTLQTWSRVHAGEHQAGAEERTQDAQVQAVRARKASHQGWMAGRRSVLARAYPRWILQESEQP